MKGLFLIAAIFISTISTAQNGEIYDDINLGTDFIAHFCGPLNNWKATHGSPDYYASRTSLYMWGNNTIGEGVCRTINLASNTFYKLDVKILSFVNNYNQSGNFKIALVNDFTQNCLSGTGSTIPTFPNSQEIYSYNGSDILDETHNVVFNTGNQSFTGIVIYPESANDHVVTLEIGQLNLIKCINTSDMYYFNSSLPSGEYDQRNAYIGSSYGSSSTLTSSITNANTTIHARGVIDIKNNTILSIEANTASIIVLDILTNPCNILWRPSNPGSANEIGGEENLNNSWLETKGSISIDKNPTLGLASDLTLTPNPARETLNITFNLYEKSDVTINIRDLSGRNVLSKSLQRLQQGSQNYPIDISKLYPGTYIFELISHNGRISKMFVINK